MYVMQTYRNETTHPEIKPLRLKILFSLKTSENTKDRICM